MRCLLIEDELDTARYIADELQKAGVDVTWCRTGGEALPRATNENWDVVVLDRLLPGATDGLTIAHAMRAAGKTTPILILSALASTNERVRGLQEGGDDYLTKPFAFAELLARLQILVRRANLKSDAPELQIADLKLDLRRRRAERGAKPIDLQPREFRLLEYLVRNQGQVVPRSMLLRTVWDYHFEPETNVIDVQISRLRQKIDRGFSPQLLHTIRGVGYMVAIQP